MGGKGMGAEGRAGARPQAPPRPKWRGKTQHEEGPIRSPATNSTASNTRGLPDLGTTVPGVPARSGDALRSVRPRTGPVALENTRTVRSGFPLLPPPPKRFRKAARAPKGPPWKRPPGSNSSSPRAGGWLSPSGRPG